MKCTSLTKNQFTSLGASKVDYICNNCLQNILPFQNLNDHEFDELHLPHILPKQIQCIINSFDIHSSTNYIQAANIDKNLFGKTSISVIHLNIRSLVKNLFKLEELLNELPITPEIIAVTETWLDSNRVNCIQLTDYNFLHVDSPNTKCDGSGLVGGVGLYVKKSLNVVQCDKYKLEMTGCENIWIEIAMEKDKQCIFGVIYKHPKTNISHFQENLTKSIELLNKTKKKYYIYGDMNMNFLIASSNSAIKSYFDNICSLGCMSVVQNPTRVTCSSATLIDHVYTNDIQSNCKQGWQSHR